MVAKKTVEKVPVSEEVQAVSIAYAQAKLELNAAEQSKMEASERVEKAQAALAQARDTLLEVAARQ